MEKVISGTSGADIIIVTESDVTVNAGAGNDTITISNGSRNVIHGDADNDNIIVKSGAGTENTVYGDPGDDIINAKEVNNSISIYGGDGADTVYGGSGNDTLRGGGGADSLFGQGGNDYIYGDAGNDKLYGNEGNDFLYGGDGDDTLYGQAGVDELTGGLGKDTFVHYASYGNDTITDYTAGDDTIQIASGSISKTELTNSGKDVKYTVVSGSITGSVKVKNGSDKVISLEDSRGSYTVSGTRIAVGKDFKGEMDAGKYLPTVTNIAGSGALTGVSLRGNANNNIMSGNAKADTLYGGNGDDKLYGYGGNDTLYGDAGDDSLTGGAGNDSLTGGAGHDMFVYSSGNDTIMDYVAGEDMIKIASGSISKTEIVNGSDVKFTVGDGSITVKNGAGKAISLEDSRGSYTVSVMRIAVGKDFKGEMDASKYLPTVTNIAGSGALTGVKLRGNENNNIMSGNAQADTLYGGEGSDKLYGYGGNDVLFGQAGSDYLYGNAGDDRLYGGSGDDWLYGQEGNDTLDGYTGNDTLYGGAGNDSLTGGAGHDMFVYSSGNDTIMDYVTGEDTIKIASGNISKTEVVNESDVKFTVGSGSIAVQNGAGKVISLEDSRGSYTVSGTRIAVGKDFKGEMDAGKYLPTVTNIAGSGALTGVTLRGNGNNNIMSGNAQADTLYGGNGDDKLYGYGGNDTLYGDAGDDSLTGGAGHDMFVYSSGNDTIMDYVSGEDMIKIASGSISKTEIVNGSDVKFTVGDGSVTVKNGAGKVISLVDSRGSYTVSGTQITLGKDFEGVMYADKYLPTVTNIDGSGALTEVTLLGNANDNIMSGNAQANGINGGDGSDTIYGGSGNDRLFGKAGNDSLYGGDGDDTLYDGSGNDTLYGGAGHDVFVYSSGNDTIMDYVAGEDMIFIPRQPSGSINKISKTEIVNGSDVKFTVGDGSITVKNGADKVISLQYNDEQRYTVSATDITLDSRFSGTMDATEYLDTVITINGQSAEKGLVIIGNAQDNTIYAGKAGGEYQGGTGNDTLYGGKGYDIFWYDSGNDTIYDFESGKDSIRLVSSEVTGSAFSGNDVILSLSNGGKITVKNMAGRVIDYIDSAGNSFSVTAGITQQNVIKRFMQSLDNTVKTPAATALNTAVNYASGGYFPTWDALIDSFISDVRNHGGTAVNGNGYVLENGKKSVEGSTDTFLQTYCGIDLTNEDTGAITGLDAGGVLKTADSIVPESGSLTAAHYPTQDSLTIGNLTINWPNQSNLSAAEQQIVAGLNTYWAEASLNLVEESYGIVYPDIQGQGFTMNIDFYDDGTSNVLASASAESLNINMHYYKEMDSANPNGVSPTTEACLDRVLAHEFTHAVMCAVLYDPDNKASGDNEDHGNDLWNELCRNYLCVLEGIAELTHGIDDERFADICRLAQSSGTSRLESAFSSSTDYVYAGGYMLLRYFAKQSAENYGGTAVNAMLTSPDIVTASVIDSIEKTSASIVDSVDTVAPSVANMVSLAASSFWSETMAEVADIGSEMASSMTSISNAWLTPLDNTGNSMLGSDSLAAGLFSLNNNSGAVTLHYA